MDVSAKTTLSLSNATFQQTEAAARRLGVSPDRLVELVLHQCLARFLHTNGVEQTPFARNDAPMRCVRRGDVYWAMIEGGGDGEPGIPHPHVVVQEDVFNQSRIATVVVCALTSNLKRAGLPGNVLLDEGEAGLPRRSVVETAKISSIEKDRLGERIGVLSQARVDEILAGLRFVQAAFLAGR